MNEQEMAETITKLTARLADYETLTELLLGQVMQGLNHEKSSILTTTISQQIQSPAKEKIISASGKFQKMLENQQQKSSASFNSPHHQTRGMVYKTQKKS